MPDESQRNRIDLKEVAARNETARDIVSGFSGEMPTLAEIWRSLEDALGDVPALSAEVARLAAELRRTRLDRANLQAAARAAVAAFHDGERDPLYYLRDELEARSAANEDTRRRA